MATVTPFMYEINPSGLGWKFIRRYRGNSVALMISSGMKLHGFMDA